MLNKRLSSVIGARPHLHSATFCICGLEVRGFKADKSKHFLVMLVLFT
jgi:hypothetical protein